MMVNIHNWLNESAWLEIRRWEETITGCVDFAFVGLGLVGLNVHAQRGDARAGELPGQTGRAVAEGKVASHAGQALPGSLQVRLRVRRYLHSAHRPARSTEPPFDRHDWSVWRPKDAFTQRYVIDYYSAPDDENGYVSRCSSLCIPLINDDHSLPVFNLDVRPALDSPSAVYWRVRHWINEKRAPA
jgi:cytochrome c heme-lyase